jgi:aconitate hydratase
VSQTVDRALSGEMFRRKYSDVFKGGTEWQTLPVPEGSRFTWDEKSTYVRKPTFFQGIPKVPPPISAIRGARVLAKLGDSVTTDHISPAGNIAKDSPAAKYLMEHGVERKEFNSYGARRGNHEVMMRGTFANTRLKNQLVPGTEGGITLYFPTAQVMPIYDASIAYQAAGTPLVILAGKEYGSGSSRDWAAKGTMMLGVRAVIAESYERIHRSNLIGMGVLPLEFPAGQNADSLGLTGEETFSFDFGKGLAPKSTVEVTAESPNKRQAFAARLRIDTAKELDYYSHRGILQFVLRRLLAS